MENNELESTKDSLTVQLIRKILDMSEEQQTALLKQLDDTMAATHFSSERDDARRTFKEKIIFSVKDRHYKGISMDISAGGMFIKTAESFSVGQAVILNIPLANRQKVIKVPAQIVRVDPEGIGVEFLKKLG